MKLWHIVSILSLAAMLLAGCGGGEATPAPVDEGDTGAYTSDVLDASYSDALNVRSQLMLGTMQLEETGNAVTPEQAQALLPLWKALQGGVTAQQEVAAVLKQIEGTMTSEQLDAIAAMQLTQEDLRTWMQERGVGFGGGPGEGEELSPDALATRQAQFGEGEVPSDMGTRRAEFAEGEMPPEMATRRAEMENMSEEEREALRATMEAGGGFPGGGGMPGRAGGAPGAGRGGFGPMLNPLIELLTARAGE